MNAEILHGDNRQVMANMPNATIDAIVTDPPYELGFMGKKWDASGIAYQVDLWMECLRILKPGGHLLAFGGTKTYHRMAVAIEDAGFEIRDSIHWIYGSGFPKSLDVSKAIDKAAGADGTTNQIIRMAQGNARKTADGSNAHLTKPMSAHANSTKELVDTPIYAYEPATDEARRWEGWGTALKPAHEPIVMARKPLQGTVAANVLQHGTGGLNIDGCRVGTDGETRRDGKADAPNESGWENMRGHGIAEVGAGRWPANVVFDRSAGEALDQQTEDASRFFTQADFGPDDWPFMYQAKPSRKERNAGLHNQNHHPTVKPITLMQHLARLVTPPGGTILDPFAGSGTTLIAAIHEGFNCIGIELQEEYIPIIQARIKHAQNTKPPLEFNK